MPRIDFAHLPDDARVWVFGASHPISADGETDLLTSVDAWLDQWAAHGTPLTCARDWTHGRFLAIGVDQRSAGASGCSIDALFRVLQQVQGTLGTSFLGGGLVFFRNDEGQLTCADRAAFAVTPGLGAHTLVYDTAVTTAAAYRSRFELPLGESWHAALRPTG
ncbi:MAG: hypothetical protein JNJ98_18995 [Gemmatimonadetes bacterium]|nr:hypothetical protein [Gemmatimonadota bacterium]